jgi:hypothetical protein
LAPWFLVSPVLVIEHKAPPLAPAGQPAGAPAEGSYQFV